MDFGAHEIHVISPAKKLELKKDLESSFSLSKHVAILILKNAVIINEYDELYDCS